MGVYRTNNAEGRFSRELEPGEVERVCQLYKEGNSIERVSGLCGISRTLTGRILREEGVHTRKGASSGLPYIDTWIDRQLEVEGPTLLERREAGATFAELARIYNVSTGHMRKHVSRLRDMKERRKVA